MSDRTRQRNNTIAGFFVLASVIGLVAMVITLSDVRSLGGRQTLTIVFPVEVGIPGLQVGSDVSVGGIKVGKVTGIEPRLNAPDHEGEKIAVKITIPDTYEVRRDAVAGLVVPLIGGASSVDIAPLGDEGSPIGEEVELKGVFAPSLALKAAGIGPDEIGRIKSIIEHLDVIAGDVEGIAAFVNESIATDGPGVVEDAKLTVADVRAMVAEVRQRWPEWAARIDRMLDDVAATTQRGPELADRAMTLMDNASARVEEVGALIDEVGPDVTATAENVREVTQRMRDETMDQVASILERAEAVMAEATDAVTKINDNLTTQAPQLSRVLSNMRLTSDNLKLAAIEIRHEPWRLLYTPKGEEVKQSLLHDAVRTYAAAVSDLEASVQMLQALHERYGGRLDPENEVVERALQDFQDRYDQYQAEERRWSEILFNFPAE